MSFPYRRLKKLFLLLRDSSAREQGWTTRALAEMLDVTERTIRDDLKKLNELLQNGGAHLESQRNQGHLIVVDDEHQYARLCGESAEEAATEPVLPDTPEERIRYELFTLLNANDYMRMEDLADSLFISRATMNNDLKILRQIIEKYSLQLSIKPAHGIRLSGSETHIRYCLAEYADTRDEEHGWSDWSTEQEHLLQPVDLRQLHKLVTAHLQNHHVQMADLALKDLITHLAVMILRIRAGHGLESFDEMPPADHHEELVNGLLRELEQQYELQCPPGEQYYIQLHIASKCMTSEQWQELQSDRLLLAVKQMLDYIHERYAYDLRDDERLPRDLYAHLKPMMIRLQHGMNMRNPLLAHIRRHYPLAYEITIGAVKQLQTLFPYDINDNEIGYLALHFGAALERKYHIPYSRRKTVLLVCGSGYGTARILESRLRSLFAELDVTRVVSLREYEQMSTIREDMVISTIRLPQQKNKPTTVVAPIPSDRDMASITRLVRTSDQQEENSCLRYFQPDCFVRLPSATDKFTLLRQLSEHLLEKGIVTSNFLPAVLEREQMASTALGQGMAIPHPLELSSTRTAVYVCLLDEPLQWDDENRVQAIFMLSICKEDYEQAMGIYDLFVELIRQEPLFARLQQCRSFDDFLDIARETMTLRSLEPYGS
ncbi:BglG family transcription antiterminator [Paenibacillus kandeliae]|uniref:BglG family transcription antiterminator n=1 Tax=Paenibacillus kandeliae TaxID=3231269 RepID=UPI0034597E11